MRQSAHQKRLLQKVRAIYLVKCFGLGFAASICVPVTAIAFTAFVKMPQLEMGQGPSALTNPLFTQRIQCSKECNKT